MFIFCFHIYVCTQFEYFTGPPPNARFLQKAGEALTCNIIPHAWCPSDEEVGYMHTARCIVTPPSRPTPFRSLEFRRGLRLFHVGRGQPGPGAVGAYAAGDRGRVEAAQDRTPEQVAREAPHPGAEEGTGFSVCVGTHQKERNWFSSVVVCCQVQVQRALLCCLHKSFFDGVLSKCKRSATYRAACTKCFFRWCVSQVQVQHALVVPHKSFFDGVSLSASAARLMVPHKSFFGGCVGCCCCSWADKTYDRQSTRQSPAEGMEKHRLQPASIDFGDGKGKRWCLRQCEREQPGGTTSLLCR